MATWLFVLAHVGLWVGIFFLMSRRGWVRFARKYPAAQRPPGAAFVAEVAFNVGLNAGDLSLNQVSYRAMIRAIPCEAGLYLYPFLLLRVGHWPFLVPWSSVTRMTKGRPLLRQYFGLLIVDSAGTIGVSLPATAESVVLSFHPSSVEQVASLLI